MSGLVLQLVAGGALLLLGAFVALTLYLIWSSDPSGDHAAPDQDRCRPNHYYTSGPVTPMSREEAAEDARVLAHRCSRGTQGCFVEHVVPDVVRGTYAEPYYR